jgi:phosphatidate cytidylyltransferase
VTVGVPVTMAVALSSPIAMTVVLGLGAGLAAWEFTGMTVLSRHLLPRGFAIVTAVSLIWFSAPLWPDIPGPLLSGLLFLTLLLLLCVGRHLAGPVNSSALAIAGSVLVTALYLGLLPATGVGLRHDPGGAAWVLAAFAVGWGGDIGAFVVGRWLGRHPLAPTFSRKKTVEGAVGSLLVGVVLGAAALNWLLSTHLGLGHFAVIGVGNVAGQVGDLFESGLKRKAGLQDSSRLLGAQGGVLDSLDGLCFVFPVLYVGRALLG